MRMISLCLVILCLPMMLLAISCSAESDEIKAGLGEEFVLAVGQSASIDGEGLTIRFIEVTEDSRCPEGVECVWEGRVTCLVDIIYSDSTYQQELTQSGRSSTSVLEFQGFEIMFDVQPYPTFGKEIKTDEYRLVLTINR